MTCGEGALDELLPVEVACEGERWTITASSTGYELIVAFEGSCTW